MEVALTIPEKLFKPNDVVNEYRFNDRVIAAFSGILTEYGGVYVTAQQNIKIFENLKETISQQRNHRKQELIEQGNRSEADAIQIYDSGLPNTYVWIAKLGAGIYMDRNSRIYQQSGWIENQSGLQYAKSFLNHFHPRALYEIPNQPGVCFPYGFIADDGKAPRNVAVTMRLIDHPDVEVFFKDSSDYIGKADDTAEDDLKWFWTMMYNRYAKTATMDSRGFRNITIDNHKGTGLFVTLTRYDRSTYHGDVAISLGAPADGSTDYGYAAIVNGDPKTNTPGQMIYVIRTASRAIAQGIQPVSKEQIKDIAEQMMASIKRHPE
ncbi:T6SS immunity protein Tli4 family protein [Sulfuriferula nivalis]|uniref:T6SS immunity protein Tli4 family protein n=1 Tax=Sulfuriferula nivalis TaxID=2675298 RepID=UPI001389B123|nr:T6SS immunity protein Tli4 family protein [Sulfuriferula nivalis]